MAKKKLIYADDLMMSIRDDPEINAKHFARCKEHIEHAPAVEAEPKRGRWECVNKELNVWMCSGKDGCGDVVQLLKATPMLFEWHYCPNCGAKMMEVDNE